MNKRLGPRGWLAAGVAALVLLTGCASTDGVVNKDPLERVNRQVFRFNDAVDAAVLAPVATGYDKVVPRPVQSGVRNFFSNLGDVWSAANAAMQLKPTPAVENLLRFVINSTVGVVGIFDVASEMRIPRTPLDLGHTLGYWGVPDGPYLMLPLLGPSTTRDGLGLIVDRRMDPLAELRPVEDQVWFDGVRLVQKRADLLDLGEMLDQVALDKYTFVRDAYLARRARQINPPQDDEEGEWK